jgi:coproporphyrinogen III oxidase-like Fe-S oxidoreductase
MSIEVKKIEKKYKLSQYDLCRYQLLTQLLFFSKSKLNVSDIELLALLATEGTIELTKFCNSAVKLFYANVSNEQFASKSQGVRNKIAKLQKAGYIAKDNQRISLTDKVIIHLEKNILLTYQLLSVETIKA